MNSNNKIPAPDNSEIAGPGEETLRNFSPAEVEHLLKRAGSITHDMDKEVFCIYLRSSYDPVNKTFDATDNYYSLEAVLADYQAMPRKERRRYGIWDVARDFPLDIKTARELKIRVPAVKIDPESGEILGYRY